MTRAARPRSVLTLADLVSEVVTGIVGRPGRAMLTALGTALGLATFVAVLGLTATAQGQISSRFTALNASEVDVSRAALTDHDPPAFPPDAQQRVAALAGVRAVGVYWQIPNTGAVSAVPERNADDNGEPLTVLAASPGYFRAIHAHARDGVLYDGFHDRRSERVAVLGAVAARRIGVTRLDAQPAIFIGGRPVTVVGIIDAVDRNPDTLLSVLVPDQTALAMWGGPVASASTKMLIETRLGAGPQVARQVKVAVRPDSPDRTVVTPPPGPHALANQVNGDLGTLFLGLAGISLLVGALGIANTSLVAVLERVPEIGLRRALGARRRHIGAQFLLESGGLGLLGGLVGTAVAIVTVVVVAFTHRWTPILDPLVVYPAPLIGAMIGLLAGLYPAWRATRIEPVDALRR